MAKKFFEYLPNTLYAFDDTQILTVKHIFRRFKFYDSVKENVRSFDSYKIQEGETPDMLSYKFYETPDYHWIILMFNDIVDPYGQWPMNHEDLGRYVESKYGKDNVYTNAHWVNAKGQSVDPNHYLGVLNTDGTYTQDMIALTNYDYEEMINNSKRKIYIPRQEYISKITSEIEKLF
jgi:hypothetical protein